MYKKILLLQLLVGLAISQSYSLTQCSCQQLQSEGDCIKNVSPICQWDGIKKQCNIATISVNPIASYARYCDQFSEADCPKSAPCNTCGNYSACAWVEGKCTFFTSCTAFDKKSEQECQAISNRCISDGNHCVEIDECNQYKKQMACVKNAQGKLCYWDQTNNICTDSNTCDKLPQTLINDKECRDMISTCTTKSGGGCIISGNNCSDQINENQCVWNQQMTISCYWDGSSCKDRICENAPISMITDEACKQFRKDGTCTTKLNGGCITRSTCQAVQIKEGCNKNIQGNECYWNGISCVDKICSNAPITITSNSECSEFLKGCITKQGGGCIQNGSCSVANIPTACVQNQIGIDCIWDTNCKEKICINAPMTNNTHELCTTYLSICTVKSGGGCQNRTCFNAPINLITNEECEAYLSGNNCITKTGGGCTINTTCTAITLQNACINNSSGQPCFWDTSTSTCKDKICLNAPSTNNTHELCQTFLNTCTVNKTNSGCVDKTCENSLTQSICDKDFNNKTCIWKGKCFKKLCVLASQSITTHKDCQLYHISCTLNNTGFGCVTLPNKCEAISIEGACFIKMNGQSCGWNGSSCIDKACSTASKNLSTTLQCSQYISTCVANNPIILNGISIIQGCQDLPISCSTRKTSENCEIPRTGFPNCLWVSSQSSCIEKSCSTANIEGTKGVIEVGQFSVPNCQNYLSICTTTNTQGVCLNLQQPCIPNNSSDGCINKPSNCNSLGINNCTNGSKISGDCYWNGSNCVDKICINIIKLTHNDCNNIFDQCTVNNAGTNCQSLQNTCTLYTTQDNCKITSINKLCIWTGIACRNATCADASDTTLYDSDLKCQKYLVLDNTCTVIPKIGGLGCVMKQSTCSNYLTQAQCHQTIQNLTGIDDCKWIVDQCYSLSTFATGICSQFKGTQTMCQQYKQGCTNIISATISSKCTVDCTLKTGINLTFQDCQAIDSTCSVKADGTGCILIQSTCQGYAQQSINCFRSINDLCVMNTSVPPTCQSVTQASDCTLVTGLTGLDHTKCQSYNSACTSLNDGTGCQIYQSNCTAYQATVNSCTFTSNAKCLLITDSPESCISINSYANCSTITGSIASLNHDKCQAYFNLCTSIANGSACQQFKQTCEEYSATVSQCTISQNGKCFLSNNTCITISNPISDCAKITGAAGTLTYGLCQSYNTACSVNRARSACIQQLAECQDYTSMGNCYRSAKDRCISSSNIDSSCVSASSAQTCEKVYLGIGNYSDANCNEFKVGCISNGNQCISKVCSLAGGFVFNHQNCNNWLSTCTVNITNSGCTDMIQKCSSQSQNQCLYSQEGDCIVYNSQCVKKSCDLAIDNENYDSDTKCSQYLKQCTVTRTGGCQSRSNCSEYISELQCQINKNGGRCFWNPTYKNCVDLDCRQIEQTTLFDSHAKCVNVDSKLQCTVRAANNVTMPGCMPRGLCSSYSCQDQCHQSINGNECVWNNNVNQGSCQDKSCNSAPLFMNSHNDCYVYYNTSSVSCTVSIIEGVLSGCQQTTSCELYAIKEQCQINSLGQPCEWIQETQKCADKSCETASITLDDDSKCRSYLNNNKCTVSDNGKGCTTIPIQCETMTQKQCYYNKNGDPCYWTGSNCITRSCENAPDYIKSEDDCNTYLDGCTLDNIKCKTKVCEDYKLTTDTLCKQEMATCTSNGINCVNRGTCIQALNQVGCVNSSTGQQCEWISSDLGLGYCTLKSCQTAPITLKNEEECQNYFINCTVKKGGGCTLKSTCIAAMIEAACTSALNGTICSWDNKLNKCRDIDCQDYNGTNHIECQQKRVDCTIGINGKCARILNCEQTTIKEACIEGLNGPCLWIDKYINSDGTKGACFQYTSCKSLNWTKDSQCKLISNQCTTNGSNCIGITLCSETNTNGGCITGYDGSCIQTIPALNSSESKMCKLFTSCNDAFYITHSECQIANNQCTTDGITGCIPLSECSLYTSKAGCIINLKGPITQSSGTILSTGICIWNNNTNKCRDQECSDLTGSTHFECQSKLSTCTSNGAICILKTKCSSYSTQNTCNIALGSDGICFWDTTTSIPNCRILSCADIPNGTTSEACQIISCVSNGTKCIPKANCSTYINQNTCNQGGLDGICIFNNISNSNSICSLMTTCSSANQDSNACIAAKDRCYWSNNSTTTQCLNHTCSTNQITNGYCTNFLNWDKKTQNFCTIFGGSCQATDPSKLSQNDCLIISGYTYTWSTFNNKCQTCTIINQYNNNTTTTNNGQSNQSNSTDQGFLFGITIIIFGSVILI